MQKELAKAQQIVLGVGEKQGLVVIFSVITPSISSCGNGEIAIAATYETVRHEPVQPR